MLIASNSIIGVLSYCIYTLQERMMKNLYNVWILLQVALEKTTGNVIVILVTATICLAFSSETAFAGSINFTEKTIKTSNLYSMGIATGDIDNDGDLDIALSQADDIGNENGDKFFWFENIGDEEFKEHLIYSNKKDHGWFERCIISDVDGDLFKDIIVVKNNNFDCQQCGGGDIVWLKNPGINLLKKGHYWESKKITSDFPSAYSLVLFDVDFDGIDDIISTQWMGGTSNRRALAWFRNPGKVYISEWEKTVIDGENTLLTEILLAIFRRIGYYPLPILEDPISTKIADLNQDKRLDIVLTSFDGVSTVFYENLDSNSENNKWKKHIVSRNVRAGHLDTADMDGDGDIDIVVPFGALSERLRRINAARVKKQIVWFENRINHDRGWKEHIITNIENGWFDVVIDDFDNDTDLDVAAISFRRSGALYVFEKIKQKEWIPHILLNNFESPSEIISVDINGDSKKDIILVVFMPHELTDMVYRYT